MDIFLKTLIESGTKTLLFVSGAVVFIVALFYIFPALEEEAISDGVCNIAVLPIKGEILGFDAYLDDNEDGIEELSSDPDSVRAYMEDIQRDPNIVGVLLDIDSGGGSPIGGERIAELIYADQVPTVALIGDLGASSGYLIASAADYIIASPFSAVGGIGVTASYLEYSKQNAESGITYVPLTSAPYKDYGSENKPFTQQERALVEKELTVAHTHFVDLVTKYRRLADAGFIEKVADGATRAGQDAVDTYLVDELGNRETARAYLAKQLNREPSEVIFCD